MSCGIRPEQLLGGVAPQAGGYYGGAYDMDSDWLGGGEPGMLKTLVCGVVGLVSLAVVLWVVVKLLVWLWNMLDGFSGVSDAYGRNTGVGTPLDFDVLRPEGFTSLYGGCGSKN